MINNKSKYLNRRSIPTTIVSKERSCNSRRAANFKKLALQAKLCSFLAATALHLKIQKKREKAAAVAASAAAVVAATAKIAENSCQRILRWPLRKCHGHCGIVGRRVRACPIRICIHRRRPQGSGTDIYLPVAWSLPRWGRSGRRTAPDSVSSGVSGVSGVSLWSHSRVCVTELR